MAYEQLINAYQGRLMRFLRNMLGPNSSVEDLVQEVFMRVWRARESYKPVAKFSTWIFHIAHNVGNNAIRSKVRKKEYQLAADDQKSGALTIEHMAMESTSAMPVRKLDKAERADMVRAAVEALSERQRTALTLSKFEGLSYQEIADLMELTPQAVKSLLSRARVNLKTLLEPYVDSGNSPSQSEPSGEE